jgi:hypothetical protein
MFWLVVLVSAAAMVWIVARIRRTAKEREQAEAARAANLLAEFVQTAGPTGAVPAASPVPGLPPATPVPATGNGLAQQKLLFDAAHKAGEAGEPALSIQLYARLLSRYPATAFANPAREAMEAQKKKLPRER